MIRCSNTLPELDIQSIIFNTCCDKISITFVDIFGYAVVDLQIVVLVECNLVGVEDVKPTLYGAQIPSEEVSL